MPTFADWRVIAAPPTADSQLVAGRLTGRRTHEFVLIPEKAGALTIPEIGYTYYDPDRERYAPSRDGTDRHIHYRRRWTIATRAVARR